MIKTKILGVFFLKDWKIFCDSFLFLQFFCDKYIDRKVFQAALLSSVM